MSRPTYATLRVLTIVGALVLAALVLALMAAQKPADAAFPGENGKIAFESHKWLGPQVGYANPEIRTITPAGTDARTLIAGALSSAFSPDGRRIAFVCAGDNFSSDVCTMNTGGSGVANVTTTPTDEEDPAWSPDGARIAFVRSGNLYAANEDGTGARQLTEGTVRNRGGDNEPTWSPDGSKIVFWRYELLIASGGHRFDLFVVNADGTGERRLLANPAPNTCTRTSPDWSPDGTRVLFAYGCGAESGFYVVNADGTGAKKLTATTGSPTTGQAHDPTWSPDGRRIAFSRAKDGFYDLFVMNADGTDPVNITNTPEVDEEDPTWQPLPAASGPTTKADCKDGGYREFGFKNQGKCIAFVNKAASNR